MAERDQCQGAFHGEIPLSEAASDNLLDEVTEYLQLDTGEKLADATPPSAG